MMTIRWRRNKRVDIAQQNVVRGWLCDGWLARLLLCTVLYCTLEEQRQGLSVCLSANLVGREELGGDAEGDFILGSLSIHFKCNGNVTWSCGLAVLAAGYRRGVGIMTGSHDTVNNN